VRLTKFVTAELDESMTRFWFFVNSEGYLSPMGLAWCLL
jgi:hypothetical protein